MEKLKWYKNAYRRGLVDMHIADPRDDFDWQGDERLNSEFFSKFSPEEYCMNMKRAHINAPMIYLQSHAGHCYFPTRVGHMHSAFRGREDMIKRTVDLCRAEGMHVVGYYSLIYNTYEEDRHPDWRIVTGEDKLSARDRGGRYGHLCPNNPEYRAFLEEQIKEIAEYFTLDGMFYDMTFWPGICRCPRCMERYKAAGFDSLPEVRWGEDGFMRLMKLRCEMIGEFAKFVTELNNKYMPGLPVEHNYANAVATNDFMCCSTELVNEWCDYTGGDLYGDLYNHSFTAKYYYNVTKNQPFEYMTCRCDKTLSAHTNTKDEARLMTEIMLTAAHHGASLIIDAIDPAGTLDKRVYERIGRIFEKHEPLEKYFRGDMLSDVAVYYSTTGRYNAHGIPFNNKHAAIGTAKALIEAHIPTAVIGNSKTESAPGYKMIFAPLIAGISDKNRTDLLKYVKGGGVLYLSGAEDPLLLKMLLGERPRRFTEESFGYISPTEEGRELFGEFDEEHPLPTENHLPVLEISPDNIKVLATVTLPYTKKKERKFASIHSNPPGIKTQIPALIEKTLGAGKVIWSAFPIEGDDRLSHREIIRKLAGKYLTERSLRSDAPRGVELIVFKSEGEYLISAVDLFCNDELLPVRDFTVALKTEKKPAAVYEVMGKDELKVDFTYEDESTRFTVRGLVMFKMFKINL